MHRKWSWDAGREVWQARAWLSDGSLSEVFAEVRQTHLGWGWSRWPTRSVPYVKNCFQVGIEDTREAAMRTALAGGIS